MKHFYLIVCFLFGISIAAQSVAFEEYDLPNGLHVILHQDNSAPVVTVNVMYHVGSKDESPQRTGFAHFFEHLLFEGTKNIERGKWFSLVSENVYKVIVPISEDKIEEYYFGVDSGLLLRSIVPQKQMGQEFMNEIEYFDYQFFDGIAFPGRYTSKSSIPQYPDTTFVLKGAEVNPENSPDELK